MDVLRGLIYEMRWRALQTGLCMGCKVIERTTGASVSRRYVDVFSVLTRRFLFLMVVTLAGFANAFTVLFRLEPLDQYPDATTEDFSTLLRSFVTTVSMTLAMFDIQAGTSCRCRSLAACICQCTRIRNRWACLRVRSRLLAFQHISDELGRKWLYPLGGSADVLPVADTGGQHLSVRPLPLHVSSRPAGRGGEASPAFTEEGADAGGDRLCLQVCGPDAQPAHRCDDGELPPSEEKGKWKGFFFQNARVCFAAFFMLLFFSLGFGVCRRA